MEIKTSTEFTGEEKPRGFLIVGIGASAGGIQSLKEFFQQVPADSGMAYVVILHLSPDHDSRLAEVLQVIAAIPVLQVVESTKIKPDHVYVVPPNRHLIINDDFIAPSINLHMEDRRAPVDIFFRNLADVHGPRAVCVVLSGTGANGSMGLKRIKERGGIAYVQNPREAEFNEMPRNSIATELVDEVLNVAEIPAHIMAYRNSLGSVQIVVEAEKRPEPQQQALREIFTQIRVRTGHDFSNYKRPTLLRRIERRINVRNLPDLPSYTAFLHEQPEETHALLKDLLISVTNFFRDGKAFEGLERDVLPAVFSGKTSEDQVRIWVAGCATGEEAYSIAMLCAERLASSLDAPKVQIFATDIDESAIANAREGLYTLNDAADVSPERLRRFFDRDGDGYRVRREIREMILFAHHNILKDPPFSRLDLVTCRNVLIYLNNTAQERVIVTFHFSLQPKGFLFLGSSESVDGASDLYAIYSRDHHIFQAREVLAHNYPVPESVPSFNFPKNIPLQKPEEKEARSQRMSFGDLHQKLLEQYAPPSVIVNEEYEIVHMTERAGRYFEFAGGEPTHNLLKLVRSEIRLELHSALYQAVQNKTAVEARNVPVMQNGQQQMLDIHIRPVLQDGETTKGFVLVIFKPAEETLQEGANVMRASDEPVARQLEEELTGLKIQLRKSIEQHEYQAEELQASNEELQAMNEELRSAAEELETSKEELQSINEELRTVNQELKVKIDETSNTSNNLLNLINSANVGTIFLDRTFAIRLFTPAIQDLFNLKFSDYGRPVTDITNKLQYDGLLHDAETVLEKLTILEREVVTSDNRFFMMRLLPYRTSDDRINGVVITFFDITKRKQSENALQQSDDRLRLLIESAKDYAIFTLDADRKVISWSSGAQLIFGYAEAEIIGRSGDMIFVPEDRETSVAEVEVQTAAEKGRAENERWHLRKDGSRFWGSGTTHPLYIEGGKPIGFVKIMRDLTVTRRLEEAKFFLAAIVETSNDSVITIDFLRNITSWNKAAEQLYGYSAEEAIGKNLTMLTLPEDFLEILNKVDEIQHSREVAVFHAVRHNKEGDVKHLEIVMSPVLNTLGEVIGISTIARDISERKRREAHLVFLAEINLDFAPLLSVHKVVNQVGEQIAGYLQLSRCHFSLVNEENDRIEVIYEYRRDEKLPSMIGVHRISDNLTEEGRRHFRAGKLAVMNATANSPLLKSDMIKQFGFGSLVDVPYLEGRQWRFLLTVGRAEVGEWRSDEVELLQELASKIYIRIERARAEEALRKSDEQLANELADSRQLQHISSQIVQEDNVEMLYEQLVDAAMSIMHSSAASLQLYVPEKGALFLLASKGFIQESAEHWRWVSLKSSSSCGAALSNKQRFIVPDVEIDGFMAATDDLHFYQLSRIRSVQSTPLVSRNGNVVGMISTHWSDVHQPSDREFSLLDVLARQAADLFERKQSEDALRQSESRFRTLADALPQVIWTNSTDGKADYFNQRWYEYTGLSYEQSEGPGWQAVVHPEDAPASVERWNKALAAGEVFDTEYRLRRHDSSYCWFIGRNVPLKGDSGKVIGWFGSATDIDNLKKTEEALSQSEVRLRITMESATDYAIIAMDIEGRVERWSKGATQLFSYTEAEMIGQSADIIFTEEDREAGVPQQEMESARNIGRAADERWHRRKNGSRFFVSGVMRPIRNSELTGYVKVMRDMTQQRLFTEELHQLVAERTRELQRSNEDLLQFAHVASHDLKEPVRKVQTFANRLKDEFADKLPKKALVYLEKVNSATSRMYAMIDGVLNYSKFNSTLETFQSVDLNEVIRQIETDLEVLIEAKKAAITVTELPTLTAINILIYQLFYNLILNSLKFSKAGEQSRIHISSEIIDEDNRNFHTISVSDNGIGFDGEYKDAIFNTFTRLNPAHEYEGTGLGLALCKKIVERHNGSISASGSENDGATFVIRFPVSLP